MAAPPLWTQVNRFQEGSFRGVPFFITSHQLAGGRRTVQHEFPQRDESRTEDMGRSIRRFTVEMFIIGEDYFDARDAMLDALELEGPGQLVHPYLGTKQVVSNGFSLNENSKEGGVARFSVDFSEAGEIKFPDQALDGLQGFLEQADAVINQSQGVFEQAFSTANQPAFVIQSASDNLNAVADFMTKSVNKFTQPVSNLTFAISNLKADAARLVRTPGELASRVADTFNLLLDEFSDDPRTSEKVLGNFKDLEDDFDDILGDSVSRTRQRDNQNAMIDFSKQQAHSNQAKAAGNVAYTSTEDAIFIREGIIDELELQLFRVTDDDLFQDISDLEANLVRALPPSTLTELITFIPPKTLPALVIAYRLFQDLQKEQEIVDQNDISHPGFVPGGVEIEVSSD